MSRMEFLVEIVIQRPVGVDDDELNAMRASESQRAAELAAAGTLVRIWRPGDGDTRWMNIGIWQGSDHASVMSAIDSLPLRSWMTISIRELQPHPSDPKR